MLRPSQRFCLRSNCLLFEWKPRSLIPVALASAAAAVDAALHHWARAPFSRSAASRVYWTQRSSGCVLIGLLAGALSALLTVSVYAAEDSFGKLPIHWMWWPALGGLVIGIGGWISPRALGVGYDSIGALLQGDMPVRVMLGLLVVKWIIWSVSLGSGTSGGVLAPLLMMGGALGGVMAPVLPNEGVGFWPLISMGAILGGTMRSPFTGVIFALELTHDVTVLLPLLVAVVIAHGFTVLTLRRSILTEKVARRGYHLSREYAVDPLEILFVREVMRTKIAVLPANLPVKDVAHSIRSDHAHGQSLYPVVDEKAASLVSSLEAICRRFLHEHPAEADERPTSEFVRPNPEKAFPDEPLRVVVYRMAETGLTRLPVVERNDPRNLVGIVSLSDLLKARVRNLEEERTSRTRPNHAPILSSSLPEAAHQLACLSQCAPTAQITRGGRSHPCRCW